MVNCCHSRRWWKKTVASPILSRTITPMPGSHSAKCFILPTNAKLKLKLQAGMSFFETKQKQPQATVTLISGTRGPLFFFTNTANWSSPNTFQNKSCLKTKWYEKIFITIPEIINFWETEKSYIQHSTSNLRSGVFVPKKNNSVFHADAKNYDIAQLSKSLSTWFVEWRYGRKKHFDLTGICWLGQWALVTLAIYEGHVQCSFMAFMFRSCQLHGSLDYSSHCRGKTAKTMEFRLWRIRKDLMMDLYKAGFYSAT